MEEICKEAQCMSNILKDILLRILKDILLRIYNEMIETLKHHFVCIIIGQFARLLDYTLKRSVLSNCRSLYTHIMRQTGIRKRHFNTSLSGVARS